VALRRQGRPSFGNHDPANPLTADARERSSRIEDHVHYLILRTTNQRIVVFVRACKALRQLEIKLFHRAALTFSIGPPKGGNSVAPLMAKIRGAIGPCSLTDYGGFWKIVRVDRTRTHMVTSKTPRYTEGVHTCINLLLPLHGQWSPVKT